MAAVDKFATHGAVAPGAPITDAAAVTPSDSAALPNVTRYLYIGVTGNVKVDFHLSGTGVTLMALAAGVFHPLRVVKVYATGTTATNIVAAW